MKVTFVSPADKELDDAFGYYEDQLSGLGKKFVDSVFEAIELICRNPVVWRKIEKNTQRINVKRFPYLLLYVHKADEILITCVAHGHRDPKYYLSRIK